MEHILYIDDSAVELAAVARSLGEAGYAVTTGTSVQDIEAKLERADLVLIDYHMPGMNGQQALAALRERSAERPDPPVFYLYTSDKARGGDYRELGFDGRIILKGNTEALLKQIRSALRIRALRGLRPR